MIYSLVFKRISICNATIIEGFNEHFWNNVSSHSTCPSLMTHRDNSKLFSCGILHTTTLSTDRSQENGRESKMMEMALSGMNCTCSNLWFWQFCIHSPMTPWKTALFCVPPPPFEWRKGRCAAFLLWYGWQPFLAVLWQTLRSIKFEKQMISPNCSRVYRETPWKEW